MELTDKEEGRLNFLMRKHYCHSAGSVKSALEHIERSRLRKGHRNNGAREDLLKEQLEAHTLFDKKGLNDSEREKLWSKTRRDQLKLHTKTKLKPQKEGRDNKDVKVGSGYPQGNTIRYPKKGRKTAWKRFYKLFPHLKPTEGL